MERLLDDEVIFTAYEDTIEKLECNFNNLKNSIIISRLLINHKEEIIEIIKDNIYNIEGLQGSFIDNQHRLTNEAEAIIEAFSSLYPNEYEKINQEAVIIAAKCIECITETVLQDNLYNADIESYKSD